MRPETLDAFKAHAIADYPREACGLVIVSDGEEQYFPCRSLAEKPLEHFILHERDYVAAELKGEITALVHSHPDMPARPSVADRAACEASGIRWIIVAVAKGDDGVPVAGELAELAPEGWRAPLVGRPFAHGVLDCYTLIRDWYREELSIELPDFDRRDGWWNDGTSDLYRDHFIEAGCEVASGPLQRGDIILMQIRAKNDVPNHAGVYLGDGIMLHHLYGRLSTRDVYGGYWATITRMVVRHSTKA